MEYPQKWVLVICFLVHVVFLISVFDIYFTSPIIKGVSSIENDIPAPAKRLVLFVGDGLRVDSFYNIREHGTLVPYLRLVIVTGISMEIFDVFCNEIFSAEM